MHTETPVFASVLQAAGHKATPARVLLLKALWEEKKPVAASYLQKKLKGALDRVTLYRNLEALIHSGVVREVDFRHDHAHYELNILRDHHHHIVCTSCGAVEDVGCEVELFAKKLASKATKFSAITDHSTEFFGLCNACTKLS